jgi:hypothetical protein
MRVLAFDGVWVLAALVCAAAVAVALMLESRSGTAELAPASPGGSGRVDGSGRVNGSGRVDGFPLGRPLTRRLLALALAGLFALMALVLLGYLAVATLLGAVLVGAGLLVGIARALRRGRDSQPRPGAGDGRRDPAG